MSLPVNAISPTNDFAITLRLLRFLGNERQVLQMQFGDGNLLVGMTADQGGFLYSGLYGGSEIIKIDPRYLSTIRKAAQNRR